MDNRVELNAHSAFDEMDSVITIPELVKFAKSNNMSAIALTDTNSVQGFPEFEKERSCDGIMHGDGMNIPYQNFFGFCGDKIPDIDLNADYETQDIIINKLNSDHFENNRLICA